MFILGVDDKRNLFYLLSVMKNKVIENNTQAQVRLHSKILKATSTVAELEKELGEVEASEIEEVEKATSDEMVKFTKRQWAICVRKNTRIEIERLVETKNQELIFPHGKFVMVPQGTQLTSPSGFHPDERVFVKPEKGCIIDCLPDSSNMSYYDFTGSRSYEITGFRG